MASAGITNDQISITTPKTTSATPDHTAISYGPNTLHHSADEHPLPGQFTIVVFKP